MANIHGIFVSEEATAVTTPQESDSGLQVVIGTAPVNQLDDPSEAVNVPILASSAAEAMAALGYSTDFENYTLCQTMYITSNMYAVAPVVYINVLDPSTHYSAMDSQTVTVSSMQATVEVDGIIKSSVTVTYDSTTLTVDEDYTLSYDSSGYLEITLLSAGAAADATELTVTGNVVDPSAVTADDIVGAYDTDTGAETGLEAIRRVYPKLGVVPGILLAPGWSQNAAVGIALAAKAANINGVFRAMAYIDLDTTEATKYTDVKGVKESSGFVSEYAVVLWPSMQVDDYIFAASAVAAARTAYLDASRDDVPSASPSNKDLSISGTCLADGTEVILDQDQGTVVGEYGVMTAINLNGYRLWGNHTAAYPDTTDAKDSWISVRRMFNWQANNFILNYIDKVDDPMNYRLIESIVDSENIRCAAYAPDHWAGASIEYLEADNPIESILAGEMTFRQHIAPYTPAETINNILSYDTDMLQTALTGGES